ncbi:hypothetical protein ACSSNL_13355 [Thalassobius sp. S69A]|uniref:hypothetical protein n=1 Tax=unclassified Thalassovita TaxID=2619711 RepID=UPI003C7AC24F
MMNAQARNIVSRPQASGDGLPVMVAKAAQALAAAQSSAEILDARDLASVVYDAAKKAARMQRAKGAHDALIAAAHRAQADALMIESEAKRRLADEYDAAQERGEVAKSGQQDRFRDSVGDDNAIATAADLGLRRDEIHAARKIRDAEKAQPGIVKQTLDRAIEERREPTRAELQRSVIAAVEQAQKRPKKKKQNPIYEPDPYYSAVVRFSSICEQISLMDDQVSHIAKYDDLKTTHARLMRNTAAALQTLKKFEEACHA